MTWDHIYPSFSVDLEDYSVQYIENREATEVEWAFHNLKIEDNVELTAPNSALAAELNVAQRKRSLSPNSDSSPDYKAKVCRHSSLTSRIVELITP